MEIFILIIVQLIMMLQMSHLLLLAINETEFTQQPRPLPILRLFTWPSSLMNIFQFMTMVEGLEAEAAV